MDKETVRVGVSVLLPGIECTKEIELEFLFHGGAIEKFFQRLGNVFVLIPGPVSTVIVSQGLYIHLSMNGRRENRH